MGLRPSSVTFVAGVMFAACNVAEACTCREPTPADAFEQADAVFVGVVVDQHAFLRLDGEDTSGAIRFTVVARHAWKGVSAADVSVQRVSACDPSFDVGVPYLIYGARWRGDLVVMGCGTTKRLEHAAADLAQFGVPRAVFGGDQTPVATALPLSRWLRAHVVVGLASYAFLYWHWDWASPSWHHLAFPSAAMLLAAAGAIALLRSAGEPARGSSWAASRPPPPASSSLATSSCAPSGTRRTCGGEAPRSRRLQPEQDVLR